MSVNEYLSESGETLYRVRVVRKSADKPGVVIQKSAASIKTLADAKKVEHRLNREAERELAQKEVKDTLWGVLVNDWAEAHHTGDVFVKPLSKGGVTDYLSLLRCHTSHWQYTAANEIDKAECWKLLRDQEKIISKSTVKKLKSAITSVFDWAISAGRVQGVTEIPVVGYKYNIKENEKVPGVLSKEEARKLLKHAKLMDHPWYAVWALALFSGMRSGELYALDWASVDFEKRTMCVQRNWTSKAGLGPTKGRYWRTVPIESDEVLGLLKELKLTRGREQFVLPHPPEWRMGAQAGVLRTFCESIGIPSVNFHALRATFATMLLRDQIAPVIVMKICGWKDLKTMGRYVRLAGVDVQGSTGHIKLLPDTAVMGRVVELLKT
jgi:integrase